MSGSLLAFAFCALFFGGSVLFGAIRGVIPAKGGYGNNIPGVRMVHRDREAGLFWSVMALYVVLAGMSGACLAEVLGLIDVSWFTPRPL